jgi:hypothetical protein
MRMGSGEGSTIRNFIVLYRSHNIVRMIRRLRWARHVANTLTGRPKPTGKRLLRRVNGRAILRWTLKK